MKEKILLISLKTLKHFLIKAKKETFASHKKAEKKDSIKTFLYQDESWLYKDTYVGSISDVGFEFVKYEDFLIWGMSYYGGNLNSLSSISTSLYEKGNYFLKIALQYIPETLPVRGPNLFQKDQWVYKNNTKGDIKNFCGKEIVLYKSKLIFLRYYHGGIIKEKNVKSFY